MTDKTMKMAGRMFAVALAMTLIGSPVLAERTVDESCDVSGPVRVNVESKVGDIVVLGGGSSVQVRGEIGDDVEDVELNCRDGKVDITVLYTEQRKRVSFTATDLEITVPAGSEVRLEGMSTNQTVKGVTGRVVLETMSGNLVVEGNPARIRAETLSGRILITAGSGDVTAEAASGDISIVGVTGSVRAETMSGDIELEGSNLNEADLAVVSGSVTCNCDLAPGGRLSADSVNGSVTLNMPDSVDATFKLETFNGSIVSTIGGVERRAKKEDGFGPGETLEFTLGSGSGTVDVSVHNGKCTVK